MAENCPFSPGLTLRLPCWKHILRISLSSIIKIIMLSSMLPAIQGLWRLIYYCHISCWGIKLYGYLKVAHVAVVSCFRAAVLSCMGTLRWLRTSRNSFWMKMRMIILQITEYESWASPTSRTGELLTNHSLGSFYYDQ